VRNCGVYALSRYFIPLTISYKYSSQYPVLIHNPCPVLSVREDLLQYKTTFPFRYQVNSVYTVAFHYCKNFVAVCIALFR
jgi:hypothetical protein